MLVTAAYEGPPYNPVTPSPMTTAPIVPDQAMAGLGNRRISPVPGCVNCVAGPGLGQTMTPATKIGLLALGLLAVVAIGFTIKTAVK